MASSATYSAESKFVYVIVISASTTATVNQVVVPQVNHISAENLVTVTGTKEQTGKSRTFTAVTGTSVPEDLSSSSSSSSSSEDDIEQYNKEPGIRQPGSRSCSEDLDIDLEEYREEPGPRKQRQGTRNEDRAARKGDSRLPDKKPGKKGPRLEVGGDNKSRTFADHVQNSPGISEDVWKEAMAGVPLASSESFDMHLLSSAKERAAGLDEDGDAFERRGRRKGKPAPLNDRVSDLKWTADLPIDDSLSRETLDDISCDSYVPPQPITGWDVDSLEIDLDDYMEEEGAAKVLDMLAQASDSAQGRVVGRRRERTDKEEERRRTLSKSFETNVDDIEFDRGPQDNARKKKQPEGSLSNDKVTEPPEDVFNQNVSNINKTKQPQTGKEKGKQGKGKGKRNGAAKESTVDSIGKGTEGQRKQPATDKLEPEEEEINKEKAKKRRRPGENVSQKRSATIPIMAADAAAGSGPFEEDEDSYSDEPVQDLSANINIRLWQGPTTNIDEDDDLSNDDLDILSSNLHDQRWEEDSIEASLDEKQTPVKPPASRLPLRDRQVLPPSHKDDIIDRLPDRPRRSQPVAPDDSQSSKQRKPAGRTLAPRPYNGILYSPSNFISVKCTLALSFCLTG